MKKMYRAIGVFLDISITLFVLYVGFNKLHPNSAVYQFVETTFFK